ncbi:helix-turn-helix domain-containing protein [Leptobacterium flavescens]|uniref:Helix-turn-helix domain-containing protein n=1 Tax=Leptobacterium flavescens TaxID=472055 RepID=A0A6P0UJZ9_9FLAO|nr:helix-turn-helix domain-containing protein [Leptobacterium flavescens]NER12730.1 helix-turn-helix domain-containing protein [Leptobacterium flavescens]
MRFFITPVFLIAFLFTTNFSFSQERSQQQIIDSLKKLSYEELYNSFQEYLGDSIKAKPYALAYQIKGKETNDLGRIADSYTQLIYISEDLNVNLKYADSIIMFTKDIKHKIYPAEGYISKAIQLYNIGNYVDALENFLEARRLSNGNNNIEQLTRIKLAIAALKDFGGRESEALLIHKELLEELTEKPDYKKLYEDDYLNYTYNLSLSYVLNKKLDSADIFIKRIIDERFQLKDTLSYYDFVATSGYNEYYKGNLDGASDSLDKAFPFRRDQNSRINYYLYKGRIARDLNNVEEALSQFGKLDSIYEIHKDPIRALPEVYRTFINYYKEKGDTENQLKYIDKLLAADSVLDANFNFLNTNITKEYDIPQLVAEKDKLIKHWQDKKVQSNIGLVVLGLLLLLSGGLFFYYYRKQRIYKRKFGYLMQGAGQRDEITGAKTKTEGQGITGISEELIKKIIGGLNAFEQQNEFLDPSITLNSLSKKLHTNSNYLSKVINHYEQKNFSNYINDLRIDYTVEQLKTNKQFRLYSVKGIAEEVGFNSTESFSKAFFKRTGIYPSYFIKKLENLNGI